MTTLKKLSKKMKITLMRLKGNGSVNTSQLLFIMLIILLKTEYNRRHYSTIIFVLLFRCIL